MKYESETMKISDQDEISDEMDEQISRLKEKVCDVFMSEKVETQVALSIFATMYVRTACDMMGLPKAIAKEAIDQLIEMHYASEGEPDDAEMHFANMEKPQWLN